VRSLRCSASGVDVAFNECALLQHWAALGLTRLLPSGFPFCPGDNGASRVEFFFECGAYGAWLLRLCMR